MKTVIVRAGDLYLPAGVSAQELTEGLEVPEQPREDGDARPYFAPTDPVVIGSEVVGGFSQTSMDHLDIPRSEVDGAIGDEALADAIRHELQADALTSDLRIEVSVVDRVAYLRGRVAGIEDAEGAEEVAGRVPQLAEVVDELDVGGD